jgi:hypothetical protein
MQPFKFTNTWDSIIELSFENEEDFEDLKKLLGDDCCLIHTPSLDKDYRYMERLGLGSQAQVDLYRARLGPSIVPS